MPSRHAGLAAGRIAGLALGAAFGVAAALRHGRPLHPQGATLTATVTRPGGGSSGVPWLDEAGLSEVTVRISRAMGLPVRWPDIYGLALRIPLSTRDPDELADLLFASTGDSPWGRFALALRRQLGNGPLTTLLPVRAPSGPLVLRLTPAADAEPRDEGPGLIVPARLVLSYAVGTGPWAAVGEVALGPRVEGERDPRRHDPVVHGLPGTSQYRLVRALREPAYAAARRTPDQR